MHPARVTLFLALLAVLCRGAASQGSSALSQDVASLFSANPFMADVPRVQQGDLPLFRPPPNSPDGWKMCDYSCLESFNRSSLVKTGSRTQGVLEVDVRYKPLPNITSDMIVWLFNNVAGSVRYTDASGNTTVIPAYQFFHGVDHLFHTAVPEGPVKVGTVFTWCELPLTGCKHNPLSATEPWTCPTNRTGFIRADPTASWSGLMETKVEQVVTHFNSSMMQFVAKHSHVMFGGNSTRTVATTRHSWQDSSEGLVLRTQLWLGLMTANSHTKFDTSLIAPEANSQIKYAYIGNARNVPAGNITAAGYMAALHFLQEYGNLPRWLPSVYNSRPTT